MQTSDEEMLSSSLHALALPLGQMVEAPVLMRGGSGLPAGALYLPAAQLLLCSTVCDAPMFRPHMVEACATLGRDVLIQRSGLFPETLNMVTADIALISTGGPFSLLDLSYLRAADGSLWLVPRSGLGYVQVGSDGLRLCGEPPFRDLDERCDGLCRAAAEVVRSFRSGVR